MKPRICKLEPNNKNDLSVSETIAEVLEIQDDIEEIMILVKHKNRTDFVWKHSFLNSSFWWIGFLEFIKQGLVLYQMDKE